MESRIHDNHINLQSYKAANFKLAQIQLYYVAIPTEVLLLSLPEDPRL